MTIKQISKEQFKTKNNSVCGYMLEGKIFCFYYTLYE
jgi:hypothetical protein